MERAQAYVADYLPAGEEPQPREESRARLSALTTASFHQQRVHLGTIERPMLALLKHWLKPSVVAIALLLCELFSSNPRALQCYALALTAFLIASQVFRPLQLPQKLSLKFLVGTLLWALPEWGGVVGLLLLLGFAFGLDTVFPRQVLLSWFGLTPVLQVAAACVCGVVLARTQPRQRRHIIVGANEVGEELARRGDHPDPAHPPGALEDRPVVAHRSSYSGRPGGVMSTLNQSSTSSSFRNWWKNRLAPPESP